MKKIDFINSIDETIKKVGDKYVLYPKKGGSRLGTHSTKKSAEDQEAAIQISKHGRTGKELKKELKDHEGKMAKSQLERSMKYSKMIYKIIQNVDKGKGVEFPAWVQSKLTKSMDYLQSVYNYLDGKDGLEDKFQDEASTTLNVPAYQTPLAYKKSTKDALDWDDEDDDDEVLGGMKDVRKKKAQRFKEDLTTPAKYSSSEAKLHIDTDIKKMSKVLGKASQEVIKIMMDGVKGGKYDALDIQRGIKFGAFDRTHEGERPFMSMLWNKVRKGFRRYMPKGKLRK